MPAIGTGTIHIRRLSPHDPIPQITVLLHRAYAGQVAMGLAPLAGRQEDSITKKRCESGECYVAVTDDAEASILGTILFHEIEDAQGPEWFRRKDTDYFSQFAVDPRLQGRGVGQQLLETVERRAVECGAVEIGLSMAEPDRGLMNFYFKRGYRFIAHWQWPYTNYRSAILSKALDDGRRDA
jgi:GNAT superfamily N-acetyltransferase